ncbi:hypothetical protein CNBA4430 [Cryptococcus deneoformans B-3501A]|uniref:Uncharacterized protein n=1 Tax=Cryptococcus deneoformans (strain JEC21 / ATCC MYA-565) TaxID=214684 RepID=Q5KP09_CRYD1|nr:hypothetical protein CNA04620 [Cryptococcus neoformans var. neoformans JEC21]XP_777974.1 hypothetical protein CNBA4430 [Cryptococcus neoformans var. neoformans B-3501A]AAW41020.1 hypothetical protein CNA04620 [Cryptococcus neoformans var. neoformans JEC21]EAL23327.1 hypothetical protein CNBA4430 [Cryptococcus neoformans var. neoformans B-3501A]
MTSFSDTSSASPLPVTPSSSRRAPSPVVAASSLATHDLSTPVSSGPYITPPPSLRLYSSALKEKMAAGMTAAMRELKGDRDGRERKYDVEYGYDEDPIERHVKLFLTPRTAIRPDRPRPSLSHLSTSASIRPVSAPPAVKSAKLRVTDDGYGVNMTVDDSQRIELAVSDESDTEMLAASPSTVGQSPVLTRERDSFVPGLIKFHRAYPSSSSLMPPRPDAWRTDSTGSTASSIASEASFEAIKAEDMVSLYGGGGGVKRAEGPFHEETYWGDESEWGFNRASMLSTSTNETVRPAKTPKRTPTSTVHTSSPTATLACSLLPRATLSPAPHQQPPPRRPGCSQQMSAASDDGRSIDGLGDLSMENDPVWLKERTLSEKMVLQAGLRSQRQRVEVRRR